jgi:hypothetical protein
MPGLLAFLADDVRAGFRPLLGDVTDAGAWDVRTKTSTSSPRQLSNFGSRPPTKPVVYETWLGALHLGDRDAVHSERLAGIAGGRAVDVTFRVMVHERFGQPSVRWPRAWQGPAWRERAADRRADRRL